MIINAEEVKIFEVYFKFIVALSSIIYLVILELIMTESFLN